MITRTRIKRIIIELNNVKKSFKKIKENEKNVVNSLTETRNNIKKLEKDIEKLRDKTQEDYELKESKQTG